MGLFRKTRHFVFQHRGLALAGLGIGVFRQARPTLSSVFLGLLVALAGETLRIWAIGFSGQITRGLTPRAHDLITGGPYSLVRNPLYVGNILNSLGVLIAASGALEGPVRLRLWIWVLSGLFFLYSCLISVEEEFLSGQFGQQYWDYHRRVPALWPRTLRCSAGSGSFSWRQGARWEVTTLWWWSFTWALLLAMSLKVRGES